MATAAKMPAKTSHCVGSPSFLPDQQVENLEIHKRALDLLQEDDFQGAINTWFAIPARDTYTYHAITSVRLSQVQDAVKLGGANGLRAWYWDADGKPVRFMLSLFLLLTRSLSVFSSC
jgi:hypothetical protein